MAAKPGRKPARKLRGSFIATFSLAAGIAGCGVAEQPPSRADDSGGTGGPDFASNPPGFSGVGGAGGAAGGISGGSGGISGGTGGISGTSGTSGFPGSGGYTSNPPQIDTPCPAQPPAHGDYCSGSARCSYNDDFNPCSGAFPTTAYCENYAWVVSVDEWSCNPPFIDEDAGQED